MISYILSLKTRPKSKKSQIQRKSESGDKRTLKKGKIPYPSPQEASLTTIIRFEQSIRMNHISKETKKPMRYHIACCLHLFL